MEDNKPFILKYKLFNKLKIILLKNGDILREESKVADTFNEFCSNVIKELKIEKDDNLLTDIIEESNLVLKAIKKNTKTIQVFRE